MNGSVAKATHVGHQVSGRKPLTGLRSSQNFFLPVGLLVACFAVIYSGKHHCFRFAAVTVLVTLSGESEFNTDLFNVSVQSVKALELQRVFAWN
jgi:N-acetylglutamate synthase-like GNAT family acetyltransferase